MPARVELDDADEEPFDMRGLRRLVAWGSGAAVAVAMAVMAGASPPGSQQLAEALAPKSSPTRLAAAGPAPQLQARAAESEAETRRLADTVRTLGADRDRMLARLNTLEHTLDDVTGSIARANAPARAGAQPSAPSNPAPPKTESAPLEAAPDAAPPAASVAPAPAHALPAGWPVAASLPLDLPTEASEGPLLWPSANTDPAAESVATRTEFGVDLGGGASVEALRALWVATKRTSAPLLDRLRPVVGIREVRPGFVELRLIVGPLVDAAAAARLCASMPAHGRTCRPAVFDGQRLALR